MMDLLKKFDYYDKITGMSEIGRRYFVINSFDGALTILGVLLGSYFAGLTNPSLIVTVGIGASVAIGVSGLWGAFLTEKAEREREIKELTKELQQAKQEFEKYKVLKEMWDEKQSLFKVLVSKLELHEKRLTELDKEIQEKTKDLEKIKIAEKSLEKILPELKNLDILKRANNLKVDLDKIIIEHNNVLSRVEEILNLEKLLNEHKDNYKKYMDIDAKIKKLSEDKEKLSKSQGEYKSLQERLESVREEINSHKEQLENIFESIRKANLPIELTAEDTAVNVKKKIKELKETINNLQSNVEELEKKIGIAFGGSP